LMKAGSESIYATLNDTVAAQDFRKRLPLTLCGSRGKYSYSCNVAIGRSDPEEKQCGWRNGDISVAGGFLDIYFAGGRQSKNYPDVMVVAHIEKENLQIIRGLPGKVKFEILRQED